MPGSVKALRLHNLILGGGLTAAQLETELNNARTAGAFEASLKQRTVVAPLKASSAALAVIAGSSKALGAILRQDTSLLTSICADSTTATAMAASATAMSTVAASTTAMAIIVASSTALAAIAASATAMAAITANTSAMTTLVASSMAKMAFYNSDTALNAIAASTTAMAACRAAAQYSIKTATENGTTSVALAWTGGPYIVLGYSRASSNVRTATIGTLRSGSAIAATATSGGTSNTTAQDVNCAIPVTSAYSFLLSGTGTVASYFGALRCDV